MYIYIEGKKNLYIKALSPRKTLKQAVNMLLFIIFFIYNTYTNFKQVYANRY